MEGGNTGQSNGWIHSYARIQTQHSLQISESERKLEENSNQEIPLKHHHIEDSELDPPISIPRRSFHHKKQNSIGNDTAFPSSPIVPTYMAATESAKAKSRSMSSPRLRGVNFDAYSESNSPYKCKLSPISSINREVTSSSRIRNFSGFEQKSPSLKGFPGPVKSNRSLKDLSFDSESSFPNWARSGSFI